MTIEPGRIINDFIEPNKRQYMIPVYQRNYEWSYEHDYFTENEPSIFI